MNKTIELVICTIAAEVDWKWVSTLSFVEFTIYSLVNASTTKSPFELVYRLLVCNKIDLLDGLYRIEGALLFVSDITKLVAEAKSKLVDS